MPAIRVKERESIDQAIRRFKRAVEKGQIIAECKDRMNFMKPSKRRKLALQKAIKRRRKKEMRDLEEQQGGRTRH